MDIRQTIAHLAQDKDEQMLLIRAAERLTAARQRNIPAATAFLAAREQTLLAQLFPHEPPVFFGGCDGAERRVAVYLPDYLEESWLLGDDSPVAAVRATFFEEDTLTHRDYLGSLMGLQIDRSVVGDILVHEEGADIIVLEDMAEFILMHFAKAGRKQLSLTREDLSDLKHAAVEEKRGTGSVASPRLDSVAALIFGLPRKDAQARIEKGLVFVNNTPCMKPEHQITEGDRLTVRGVGRARVEAFGGTSRKGRIFLEYVRNA